MTRYGLPITCSIGRLPECGCLMYYSLADDLEVAKRRAIELADNPPILEPCTKYQPNVERFLVIKPPCVVDTVTGEIYVLDDSDLSPHLYS